MFHNGLKIRHSIESRIAGERGWNPEKPRLSLEISPKSKHPTDRHVAKAFVIGINNNFALCWLILQNEIGLARAKSSVSSHKIKRVMSKTIQYRNVYVLWNEKDPYGTRIVVTPTLCSNSDSTSFFLNHYTDSTNHRERPRRKAADTALCM